MKEKHRTDRRLSDLLMKFHVVAYAAMWIASMYVIATYTPHYSMIIAITLVWTVFLFAHVAVHFYSLGQSAFDEREIYREGFSDAMHQFADHAYDARQHIMVDDGEFQELIEKPKRYR